MTPVEPASSLTDFALGILALVAAIMVSILAAGLKASSAQFTLGGWEFDANSLYHVAQMPGLFLLLVAIRRRARQSTSHDARLAAPA